MPGIAAKEDGLSRLYPMHFARFRVGDDHDAAQYIKDLVGRKDRAKLLRVPEGAPGRQAKEQLMDSVTGDIYPIRHFSSLFIPPQMTSHPIIGNVGRVRECRPGRRGVTHEAASCVSVMGVR